MSLEMSDPTRSGFSVPAIGTASLSLSEVEALCLKAARGAGLPWGLAEEAGFAARWLYARGLHGPEALLEVLDRLDTTARVRVGEDSLRPVSDGQLLPIAVGAALSDFAGLLPARVAAGPVLRPILLLPFVHQRSQAMAAALSVTWSEGVVRVDPDGTLRGDATGLDAVKVAVVTTSPADDRPGADARAPDRAPDRVPLAERTLARLNDFAMSTTVPATAASRADAGSAGTDND